MEISSYAATDAGGSPLKLESGSKFNLFQMNANIEHNLRNNIINCDALAQITTSNGSAGQGKY